VGAGNDGCQNVCMKFGLWRVPILNSTVPHRATPPSSVIKTTAPPKMRCCCDAGLRWTGRSPVRGRNAQMREVPPRSNRARPIRTRGLIPNFAVWCLRLVADAQSNPVPADEPLELRRTMLCYARSFPWGGARPALEDPRADRCALMRSAFRRQGTCWIFYQAATSARNRSTDARSSAA
jgi:hypothetical protein